MYFKHFLKCFMRMKFFSMSPYGRKTLLYNFVFKFRYNTHTDTPCLLVGIPHGSVVGAAKFYDMGTLLAGLFSPRFSIRRTWTQTAPTTDPCESAQNQTRRVGVSPLSAFDFMLTAVELRSRIMFLSTSCKRGAKQTTNLK